NKPIWPENPPQSAKIPPHDSQSVKKSDPQQATAPTQSEFQQPARTGCHKKTAHTFGITP
ncbi:hypothetical protein, partial [Rhizobium sp. NZLR10]|uniref:hypothetical protein n=1 Tax=Rhizobium sp. NZLR10 TaxID=2731097 RepID=UPI001C8302B1